MTVESEAPINRGFIVRRAHKEDIPAVMLVNYRSLPENYWYGFFEGLLEAWGNYFYVAEVNGEIVGYAMSRVEWTSDPVLIGIYNELEEGPLGVVEKLRSVLRRHYRVVHLISIAVLEQYRGRGIGSELLRRTIETAKQDKNIVSVYLEVRVSNTLAIRLYEKFGFHKARIIRAYYRDGEDAFVMVLPLRNPSKTSYWEPPNTSI